MVELLPRQISVSNGTLSPVDGLNAAGVACRSRRSRCLWVITQSCGRRTPQAASDASPGRSPPQNAQVPSSLHRRRAVAPGAGLVWLRSTGSGNGLLDLGEVGEVVARGFRHQDAQGLVTDRRPGKTARTAAARILHL
jgi:hypothetical protein